VKARMGEERYDALRKRAATLTKQTGDLAARCLPSQLEEQPEDSEGEN